MAAVHILASRLHRIHDDDARALVDQLLGASDEWASKLIEYRLSAPFQADFKSEWGHWLHTAGLHGFQRQVVTKVLDRAKRDTRSVDRDPNDKLNLVLAQELAPAMFAHYLCGTGWTFRGWEPIIGGDVDVDLQLSAPDGTPSMLQVKSPDQPGRMVNHRIVDGEFDDRIIKAVANAASQLPKAGPEAKLIAVSANRTMPLSSTPQCLVTELLGSTVTQESGVTVLPRSRLGKFSTPEWSHVSGVVILDYVRSALNEYRCTVLLNPWALVRAASHWFPGGRVAVLDGARFRWAGGEPSASTLPDGTLLVG